MSLVAFSAAIGLAATLPPTAPPSAPKQAPAPLDGVAAPHEDAAQSEFLRAGSFTGSILIPGTDVSLKLGGFVKLDAIHDFDAIGDTDAFKTSTIPVPEESSNGNTTFHAKETRLSLDARSTTDLGDLRIYVEGDFFGSSDTFRLRHAYGELDRFMGGQTWTNFMDVESRPDTLDYEGPDGSVFLRQSQVRWSQPLGEGHELRVALEEPDADVTAPVGATDETVLPDLTVGLHMSDERFGAYLSAIARQVGYEDPAGPDDDVFGWGVNLSGKVGTWNQDDVRFQIAYGEGIASYIEDLRGLGANAAPDGSGDLEALPVVAGFLAYRHLWSSACRSSLVYSLADVDNSSGQAGTDIQSTEYIAVNLIWSVTKRAELGLEYLHGTRENEDGDDADANRVQFSAKWSF